MLGIERPLSCIAVLIAMTMTPANVSAQAQSPWEVNRAWNAALSEGDAATAKRLTSRTTLETEYWKRVKGIDGLIEIYREGRANWMPCSLLLELLNGSMATVAYQCPRRDGTVRIWEDKMVKEDGLWKVAAQYVKTIRIK